MISLLLFISLRNSKYTSLHSSGKKTLRIRKDVAARIHITDWKAKISLISSFFAYVDNHR